MLSTSNSNLLNIKPKRINSPYNKTLNFPPKPRHEFRYHTKNGINPHDKIIEIFNIEFEDELPYILLKSKEEFLSEINSTSEIILNELYSNKEIIEEKFQNILLEADKIINDKYIKNYNFLSKAWNEYEKNPKKFDFLKQYRKHCIHTDEYAYHSCETLNSKLIEIPDEKNKEIITHLICINCKKCYFSNKILLYCNYDKIEYFSSYISKDKNPNILPATWEKYHCSNIINDTMKCLKCKNILYLDLNTNYLICINKNCGFRAKPNSIIWNCGICKKEFKSNAKIFNPMEMQVIKRSIKLALLFKKKIYPNELPCCKINNIKELNFYHKDGCNGELYKGILNKKEIIVCSKCKAMNFSDKFYWTCPLCKTRFRNKKSYWGTLFEKKDDYLIDDKFPGLRGKTGEKRISFNGRLFFNYNYFDKSNINNNQNNNNNNNLNIRSSSGGVKILSYNQRNNSIENDSFYRNNSGLNNQSINNLKSFSKNLNIDDNHKMTKNNSYNKGHNFKKLDNQNNFSNNKGKKQYQTLIEILEERDGKSRKGSSNQRLYNHKKSNSQCNFSNDELNIKNNISFVNNNNNNITNISLVNNKNNNKNSNFSSTNIKRVTFNKNDYFYKSKSKDEKTLNEEINKIKQMNSLNETIENLNENNLNEYNNNNLIDKKLILNIQEANNKKINKNLINIPTIREITLNQFSYASSTITENLDLMTSPDQLNLIIKQGTIPLFNIENYIIQNPIGEGSYGKIYLIEKKLSHEQYALKKIICHGLKEVKQFQKEFELIYSKTHENIMKIYNIEYKCLDSTTYSIYVLMELALSDWNNEIKKRNQKKNYYSEIEIIKILNQIINALIYLEKEGIAHRDIKPQNILIYSNDIFKVADFGEAKNLKFKIEECTIRGSELYMSPILYNCLKNRKKDVLHNAYKSDVYSLGLCLIYSLTLSINVLNEIREIYNMNTISNIVKRNIRRNYSNKLQDLVIHMIELDENKRFSFKDIREYIQKNFKFE